ncbi:von Willebrand factor A domain containing 5B1 [Rhinolophus ferrumequinum]|uniref:von Willebrand factor A domain containing 5B1 n=1 Tax=Rhinolophus ferrumequinum TaxID=59479 RepID=A0A7J7X8Q0_RHIFE|nr:von Willebrand factor A domain containing 5B1 [Rhinolophus ferrumequinum]
MPGLLNQTTGAALPLTASDVTSFVSGYALGLTASLTYGNLEAQPFQGLFVYPLDEYTTVIGFEAVIADRVVTVQIKDKAKMESGHFNPNRIRAATFTGGFGADPVRGQPGDHWPDGERHCLHQHLLRAPHSAQRGCAGPAAGCLRPNCAPVLHGEHWPLQSTGPKQSQALLRHPGPGLLEQAVPGDSPGH